LSRPWTVISYQFLHANLAHLFFNMIALFFFGPRLEVRLGSRHFLGLYLTSGVFGALLSVTTPGAAIVGASGAVFGVLLGYARFWPRDRILIWAIIPVEARVFVVFLTVLSLVSGLSGRGGNIAHFAHLGGFLGGWVYLKLRERTSPARKFQHKTESAGVRMKERDVLEQWKRIEAASLHEVNREEYERISEKIRSQGPSSLSARERTFVERFSRSGPD
ncbi:MAG: rhomboid family intramembrane serine protease, partial [Gemmatimonadota bacterium]